MHAEGIRRDDVAYDDSTLDQAFDAWEEHGGATHRAIEREELADAASSAHELAAELTRLSTPTVELTDDERATLRRLAQLMSFSGNLGATAERYEKRAAELLFGARLFRATDSGVLEVTADTASRLRGEYDDIVDNIERGFLDAEEYRQEAAALEGLLARAGSNLSDAQLDGLACIVCGGRGGSMVPAGEGPRGQLFRHPNHDRVA